MFRLLFMVALLAGSGWSVSGSLPDRVRPLGSAVASDTLLADSIRAGRVFIRPLPARIDGRNVESYDPVRVPADGWLYDRSIFWRVPASASGTHRFAYVARLAGGGSDTVTVSVTVAQ